MKFNINDYVRVRLTDHGRLIDTTNRREFQKVLDARSDHNNLVPALKEEGGWSKWEFWSLMERFGPHMGLGREVPFSEIELIETAEQAKLKEETVSLLKDARDDAEWDLAHGSQDLNSPKTIQDYTKRAQARLDRLDWCLGKLEGRDTPHVAGTGAFA